MSDDSEKLKRQREREERIKFEEALIQSKENEETLFQWCKNNNYRIDVCDRDDEIRCRHHFETITHSISFRYGEYHSLIQRGVACEDMLKFLKQHHQLTKTLSAVATLKKVFNDL